MAKACPMCGEIGDREHGAQKGGWPEESTFIPAAIDLLTEIQDLGSDGSRLHKLLRCPSCGDYFRYDTDYEFIVPGTEDSQILSRLEKEQAAALRSGDGR